MNREELLKNPKGFCTEKYIRLHFPQEYAQIMSLKGDKFAEKLYRYWYPDGRDTCIVCGKPTKFKSITTGFLGCCSQKCSYQSEQRLAKAKATNLKKYGTENVSQNATIKQKKLKTVTENYGGMGFGSKSISNKSYSTIQEKYGVQNASQSKEVKQKKLETSTRNYGGLGFDSKTLYKRAQQTTQNRYGSKYISQTSYYKDKVKDTKQQKMLANRDYLLGYEENGNWIIKCPHLECNKCSEKRFSCFQQTFHDRLRWNAEVCTKLNPVGSNGTQNTSIELFIQNLLKEYGISYQCNTRDQVKKELDIYIPAKHIGIECNGIYWHSSRFKLSNHHYDKWKICKDNGIQLLTLWEDWFRNKPEIVKSLVLSKLGIYQNKIGARECIIKEVDSHTAQVFLDTNHIQGACRSKIRLSLYKNDELVSLMCFNKRSRLSGSQKMLEEWELVRFCNKPNMSVIGGASKLFKFFIYNYTPETVVSFASNDISDGGLYRKLGFEEGSVSVSYWYLDGMTRYHRSSFSKDAIIRKGWKDNKEGWTEDEVTNEQGLLKIWDSGTTKWIWKCDQK